MLGADAFKFDETIKVKRVGDGEVKQYMTKGIVVDEKLKKSK